MIITKAQIIVGDILYIRNPVVDKRNIGSRPFVVLGKGRTNSQIAMLEISGANKCGDNYPYNEPIKSSVTNGLSRDSHVKCDMLYIYCEYIIPHQVIKFGKLEPKYISKIEKRMVNALNAKVFFFIDQSNNGRRIRA